MPKVVDVRTRRYAHRSKTPPKAPRAARAKAKAQKTHEVTSLGLYFDRTDGIWVALVNDAVVVAQQKSKDVVRAAIVDRAALGRLLEASGKDLTVKSMPEFAISISNLLK